MTGYVENVSHEVSLLCYINLFSNAQSPLPFIPYLSILTMVGETNIDGIALYAGNDPVFMGDADKMAE